MNEPGWYEPTDDEAETIERAGLTAAWHELQPLKDDDLPTPKKVLACLKAFKAAGEAVKASTKALKESRQDDCHIQHFPETTDMVCSALMALDFSPEEIHPSSVLGARLSALIQATKALEAMGAVYSAFDDDDGVFGTFLADETVSLAKAFMRQTT